MAKMLVKNLKHYSIVVFSWNDKFNSVSFEPDEIKDLSGIQINTEDNFKIFVQDYVRTNIITLIPIYDEKYVPVVLEDGYFDFAYVDYGWVV
jgi:hypothetical protein